MAALIVAAVVVGFVFLFYILPIAIGLTIAALPYVLAILFILWLIQ
jgi:hypothetical protein